MWDSADVPPILEFLIQRGVLDEDETVRSLMVDAGIASEPDIHVPNRLFARCHDLRW